MDVVVVVQDGHTSASTVWHPTYVRRLTIVCMMSLPQTPLYGLCT